MSKLFIPVIEGTTRPDRKSILVSRLIVEVGNQFPEVEAVLVDPLDFNMPFDGNDQANKDPKYSQLVQRADGFFVVIPEYNHSFPGSLKRFIDSELESYNHKPVALAGVSSGPWGGVRGIESFVPAIRETGLVALSIDVQFPRVQSLFDIEGNLLDQAYIPRIKKVFQELIWMAKVFKQARTNPQDFQL